MYKHDSYTRHPWKLEGRQAVVVQRYRSMVAAALRTIVGQPDRSSADQRLALVAESMASRSPKAAKVLRAAEEDVLAYMGFPSEPWTRVHSTKVLKRLNKEIKRRTKVVGIFPDVASVERLVGTILMDIHDEWQVGRRYFSLESMRKLTTPEEQPHIAAPLHLEPVR